jgi:hypothetical protein
MRRRAALAVALALAATPSRAQHVLYQPLLDRLRVDPAQVTRADCTGPVESAPRLNAMELFRGAAVCAALNIPVEGNFLLVAGQVRAITDMSLMLPESEADRRAPAALYGLIFFQLGGPGREEVYRDSAATARLLQLLDAWSPALAPTYDPGWSAGRRPDVAAYQTALAEEKARRRRQLTAIARAFSDDDYYALHQEFTALQQRVRVFVEGTPDAARADALQRRMDARARALGVDFRGN